MPVRGVGIIGANAARRSGKWWENRFCCGILRPRSRGAIWPLDRPFGGAYKQGSFPLGARSSAVEHLTFNQRVEGSIPSGLTKLNHFVSKRYALSRGQLN